MSDLRAHVFVSGRVQGVFFRDSTQRHANARGVRGWVRNLPDGRVEAVFEGDEQAVRHMVSWCKQGPPNAYVTDVGVDYEAPDGKFSSFSVRHHW
ncbi:MAG: acylphosphatase [Anaerolineae bacterium]|jgi:acylphosphatase